MGGGDSPNLPLRFSKVPQSSLLNPEGSPDTPSMGPRLVPEANYAASAVAALRVSPVPPGSRGQRESYGEPGGDVGPEPIVINGMTWGGTHVKRLKIDGYFGVSCPVAPINGVMGPLTYSL